MITSRVIPKKNSKKSPSISCSKLASKGNYDASFQGKINTAEIFSTKLHYKKLCSKDKFTNILNNLEPSYKEYFEEILSNYRAEVNKNPHLFKNMPKNIKKEIENGHIYTKGEKGFAGQLIDAIAAPFNYCKNSVKNKFRSKEKLAEIKKFEDLKNDITNVEGLIEYVNNLKEKNPQIVKKLIQDKIKNNFKKIKANYSSNLSTTMTDLATFAVAAGFHGCDFYNITRRVDDDHKAAMKEAKVKVKQDTIRMVVMSYLTYVVTTLFKKDCNRSMTRMLAVASVIQVAAEIINRKMTGRPILPLNKQTLDEYNEKQKTKDQKHKKNLSFTGSPARAFFSKEIIFPKAELQKILELTKKINPEQAKRYAGMIEEKLSGAQKGEKLDALYSNSNINNISLGKKESPFERTIKCVFIPITAIIKLAKRLSTKEKPKTDEFLEVKNYLNFTQKLLKSKYKNKDVIKNNEDFKGFRKDIMNASLGSFRSSEANYNTANYSIIKRIFSYSIFTTFFAWDAYNVTMMHSDGDKETALIQAKQRVMQEITRFFISIYTASANLTLFGALYNKSVSNAFGLTAMTSTLNNFLTRKTLGLPITPKNKEQLEELDENNKKSSFHRFTNKLTGKENN